MEDFKVNLLGGAWSLQTKGKAVVACFAPAKTPRATNWRVQYGMYRPGRFEVSLYGEQAAQTFAGHGPQNAIFPEFVFGFKRAPIQVHPGRQRFVLEPAEFTALASTLKGKVLARAAQLRGAFPL